MQLTGINQLWVADITYICQFLAGSNYSITLVQFKTHHLAPPGDSLRVAHISEFLPGQPLSRFRSLFKKHLKF